MNIRVVYRNYRPLHSTYTSFYDNPIEDIAFSIPKVNEHLRIGYSINRRLRYIKSFSYIVDLFQKYYFKNKPSQGNFDGYFFAGLLPNKDFDKPFVLDFEHVYALFDYGVITEQKKDEIFEIIMKKNCIAIFPWSSASEKTLLDLYPSQKGSLKNKSKVLYPALPNFYEKYKDKSDQRFIKKQNDTLDLLFIGKEYRRKGLIEVLDAMKRLKDRKVNLYVISPISDSEKSAYSQKNIFFIEPKYTLEDLVKYFFIPADIFIMPTHSDTFGMVYLESLSSGTPIISTEQFAVPEFLKPNVNGFFVDSDELYLEKSLPLGKEITGFDHFGSEEKLVESIYTTVNKLIDEIASVREMTTECTKDFINNGKFSITCRNELIRNTFDEY